MKKLMIVAALAASTVAIADDCAPVTVTQTLVYQVKMNVKTTKGLSKAYKGTASVCNPGETSEGSSTVIRAKDTTKFQGWIYDCTATCDTIKNGTVVMWDTKRKAQLNDAAFETAFLNVMGKNQKDAEWAWAFTGAADYGEERVQTYTLTGAGYGKFDTKKGYYKSFSGNFAGTATASYDLSKKVASCDPSQIWLCEALSELTDSDTVAFGTWTAKYNSSASKKFAKNGYLKVPNYVVIAE